MPAKGTNKPTSPAGPAIGDHAAALGYILLGDLRDLLEEPANEETSNWLRAILDTLLETLPHGETAEAPGDYMSEVLSRYPSWFAQVNRLQQEHRTLYANLRHLRDRISQHRPFAEIAQQLRQELRAWMNTMIAHHRHENRLLMTAMTLEVGAGD